jgi:hypothetical protein
MLSTFLSIDYCKHLSSSSRLPGQVCSDMGLPMIRFRRGKKFGADT